MRVLVLGDSYTAGDGVDNRERFTDLLAAMHGVEVLNCGVSGTAPDQHALLLEELAPTLRPDLVILAVTVHTIARIQQKHRVSLDRFGRPVHVPRAHFVLDAGALRLCTSSAVPAQPTPVAGTPDHGQAQAHGQPVTLCSPWRVALGDRLGRALGTADRARARQLAALAAGPLRRAAQRLAGVELDPDYVDPASPGWLLLSRVLERCRGSTASAPLVIAPLPTPAYVLDRLTPRYSERFRTLDDPARGCHVIDTTSSLASAPAAARLDYVYRRDAHPTCAGHRALALALSRALVERGLLPPSIADAPRPHPREARCPDLLLRVGWSEADAFAEVHRAGTFSIRAAESDSGAGYACAGMLPYAAISRCLEATGVDGPELSQVELIAPERVEDLLRRALTGTDGRHATSPFALPLAPFVRWEGAAERDLRRLLHYAGPVSKSVAAPSAPPTANTREVDLNVEADRDVEGQWLARELARLLGSSREANAHAPTLRAFRALCARWERATRRARWAAVP
ncbi:MAG: hypothetical protein R3F49_22320 [Planctomycetota bacterium]